MSQDKGISISVDLGIDYADCGPWRSYELVTQGDSYAELYNEAVIAEIDQDGGELSCYGIDDAENAVHDRAVERLGREIERVLKQRS